MSPSRSSGPGRDRGEVKASWGSDGGVRIVPIPVSGTHWSRRALRSLFTDFRPDIIQIEEEPWTPVAHTATGQASALRLPVSLFTLESLARNYSLMEGLPAQTHPAPGSCLDRREPVGREAWSQRSAPKCR